MLGNQLRRRIEGFTRCRIKTADQTLGQNAVDRRGDQVAFDAHVQQTGNTRRRAVGVQRREHQVTGQRGLNGDTAGFQVTHLTDHDDIRVLTHDGAQCPGEVQADGRLDLNLIDALELILDRVFDGDDLALGGIEP